MMRIALLTLAKLHIEKGVRIELNDRIDQIGESVVNVFSQYGLDLCLKNDYTCI